MKKKGFLIYILVFGLFLLPKTVFASNSWNGTASVGRSAVLDTSNNYYYTDWKLLSSNSLNIIPVPYSGGQYYHMGAEYSFPFTAMGDTTYVAQFRVPVVSNTIYNYTLMNGLNQSDVKVGIDKDFSIYNVNWTVDNINWECSTYPSLGVAHNYCYYDVKVHFTITDPIYGAYNLNFAVLNTTASRSSYYYDGYDSQGCAIEFPNAASGSGYPLMSPSVILNGYSSGGGGNTDTDEITDSIDSASQDIQDAIQESYENLVKSQQVCVSYDYKKQGSTNTFPIKKNGYYILPSLSEVQSSNWMYTEQIKISKGSTYTFTYSSNGSSTITNGIIIYENGNIRGVNYSSGTNTFTADDNGYIYINLQSASGYNYTFKGEYCINGNQAINDKLDDLMNDNLNEFDSSGGGAGKYFDQMDLGSSTPLTDLITFPITLLNKLHTEMNNECSTYNLPFNLWGNGNYTLRLPCINYATYLGSSLWETLDYLMCFGLIYSLAMMIITYWESWTSLQDTFDSLYDSRPLSFHQSQK